MKDLLKPRTIFAACFYFTFCYLIITNQDVPRELTTIIATLMGWYFGQRSKNGTQNKT